MSKEHLTRMAMKCFDLAERFDRLGWHDLASTERCVAIGFRLMAAGVWP